MPEQEAGNNGSTKILAEAEVRKCPVVYADPLCTRCAAGRLVPESPALVSCVHPESGFPREMQEVAVVLGKNIGNKSLSGEVVGVCMHCWRATTGDMNWPFSFQAARVIACKSFCR